MNWTAHRPSAPPAGSSRPDRPGEAPALRRAHSRIAAWKLPRLARKSNPSRIDECNPRLALTRRAASQDKSNCGWSRNQERWRLQHGYDNADERRRLRPMALKDWAQLLLLGAIWGGSFFFARIAVAEIPPLVLVLFRVLIAASPSTSICSSRPVVPPSPSPTPALFFGLALLNNVIPFSLIFAGQTETRRRPGLGAQRHDAILDADRRQHADQRRKAAPATSSPASRSASAARRS